MPLQSTGPPVAARDARRRREGGQSLTPGLSVPHQEMAAPYLGDGTGANLEEPQRRGKDELRIVDLALLSNRKLAHRGHAALAEVLETESPEIVEAHPVHWLAGVVETVTHCGQ